MNEGSRTNSENAKKGPYQPPSCLFYGRLLAKWGPRPPVGRKSKIDGGPRPRCDVRTLETPRTKRSAAKNNRISFELFLPKLTALESTLHCRILADSNRGSPAKQGADWTAFEAAWRTGLGQKLNNAFLPNHLSNDRTRPGRRPLFSSHPVWAALKDSSFPIRMDSFLYEWTRAGDLFGGP